jgi:hypothetical protein
MTKQEIAALVEILSRFPLTLAERLWVEALLNRLAQGAPQDGGDAA